MRKSIINAKENAIKSAWKIPGLYGKDEARFLYSLACRKGTIVELGCWMGRTSVILNCAAKVWGAEVISVDSFVPMPHNIKQSSANRWKSNMKKAGLVPHRLIESTSVDASSVINIPLSLVFIDANHSLEEVYQDLMLWTPKIKPGGVVALHDMFYPSIVGVCEAVTAWWISERDKLIPRWKLVGLIGYTIAFKRIV